MLKYKEAILYLVIIVIAFIFIAVQTVPKAQEVIQARTTKAQKLVESKDLEAKIAELDKYEKQKEESFVEVKKIYQQESPDLDPEAAFTVTFEDIINMAKYNSVKVFSLNYTYNPPSDEFVTQSASTYNVCQLDMELVSDYQNFSGFLKELYKYPYLINIDKIELMAYQKNKKILLIKLSIKLYTKKG